MTGRQQTPGALAVRYDVGTDGTLGTAGKEGVNACPHHVVSFPTRIKYDSQDREA